MSGDDKAAATLSYQVPAGIKLHVGGLVRQAGWTVLDAVPGPHVDIVADCRNLSMLQDGSCSVVYASHVLEHLGYDADLPKTLGEFRRVLAPGGVVLASVPDLDRLCRLFVDENISINDKFIVMRMMFGGRKSDYDVHYTGLNFDFLKYFFEQAGFVEIVRVDNLGCFQDASLETFAGVPISVNVVARNPA